MLGSYTGKSKHRVAQYICNLIYGENNSPDLFGRLNFSVNKREWLYQHFVAD